MGLVTGLHKWLYRLSPTLPAWLDGSRGGRAQVPQRVRGRGPATNASSARTAWHSSVRATLGQSRASWCTPGTRCTKPGCTKPGCTKPWRTKRRRTKRWRTKRWRTSSWCTTRSEEDGILYGNALREATLGHSRTAQTTDASWHITTATKDCYATSRGHPSQRHLAKHLAMGLILPFFDETIKFRDVPVQCQNCQIMKIEKPSGPSRQAENLQKTLTNVWYWYCNWMYCNWYDIYTFSFHNLLFSGLLEKDRFSKNNPVFSNKVFGYGKLRVNYGKLWVNYVQIMGHKNENHVF